MKNRIKLMVSALSLLAAGQVSAVTSWTLGTTAVTASGVTVTATGWADTGATVSGSTRYLEQQTAPDNLALYGGGLGINNKDGCTSGTSGCSASAGFDPGDVAGSAPEHAIDNQGRKEMVLLSFSSSVTLSKVNFGWTGGDSDFTVAAYTGSGTASDNLSSTTAKKTWATLGAGWDFVGNYSGFASGGTGEKSLATTKLSSYWLIGAYNPLGGAADSAYGGSDYFKLKSVTASLCAETTVGCSTPSRAIPEPGSMALFGLALMGLFGVRKSRRS